MVEGYTNVEPIVASTKTEYSEETTTIKDTLTVTETAATTSTPTTTATNIVRNGRFTAGLTWWTITRDSQIATSLSTTNGNTVLRTANMFNNNLFEMSQQLTGLQGTTYNCRYDWHFTNHYETMYNNGNAYVPYVHIYISNDLVDNSTPQPPRSAGVWYTTVERE